MTDTLKQYVDNINKRYKLGNATEHTFRGDLQQLLESLVPAIRVTNEPKQQLCGKPDYILTRKEIEIGFIEAKDIGDIDLDGKKKNKEQFDRYKKGLDNIIFTDYLDFHLFNDGEFVTKIAIAELTDKGIKPLPENFTAFIDLIKNFCIHTGQPIKSSKKLAEIMAGKARLLADVIEKALLSDEDTQENSTLNDQLNGFKQYLIHDITPRGFADVYAQTIAYGMFAARLHDPSLDTFSRQEAYELIPKSNPFLRKLFLYIAGADIDDRIKWIVDSLVGIFLVCNVEDILKNYGKATKTDDPIIHFYETFLSEYDPKLRKSRGVWYTPAPVVNFIVRAVDDILKTEFDLPQGLADNSKTTVKINLQETDKRYKDNVKTFDQEVHKVQILDPATGTGTFLAETIRLIHTKFEGQQGIWSNYVETHLLPRLNGFELLMASYAMAHMKLDLLLIETGYKPAKDQRLRVYLTNSLEESHPDTGSLFASWLSAEANEANYIKRDTPVMVVLGNPPYSVSSSNKSEWIEKLTADYKKDLNERNIQPLSDDYIKFIRFGQHFIDKNGSGVLAYISNNSFIDGIIHRQMRKNLLESFDKIYILDLHGNAKKKEVCPDGSPDQNVFDIMQGVSINIFVKTGKKKKGELGQVFHSELFGIREFKYDFLNENSLTTIPWDVLNPNKPNFFLVKKDFSEEEEYINGFAITDLLTFKSSGIKTHDDINLVSDSALRLEKNIMGLNHIYEKSKVFRYSYRPFDKGFIYYDTSLLGRARENTIYHFKNKNVGLILVSQPQAANLNYFDCVYLTDCLTDTNMFRRGGPSCFPLYLYPKTNIQQTIKQNSLPLEELEQVRTPNLNMEIVKQIADKLGLEFTVETQNLASENDAGPVETHGRASENDTGSVETHGRASLPPSFAPIDILDYIYAVLHSPTYREKYKEFLKIDFPRVPYPKDQETFWQLVKLGGEIRQIHLLESPAVEKYITQYPIEGDNVVTKVNYHDGRVYINEIQYFANVPEIAWNFYIGGYQPAQKWLKDRKDRKLEYDDIFHYQKIIVALSETARIMKEIDCIEIE